jgi:hypothetical protein
MKSRIGLLVVAMGLAIAVAPFQNCTNQKFTEASSSSAHLQNSGGNYDGKTYVFHDHARPCVDGSTEVARITERTGLYTLKRENCQTLPGNGQSLAASEVQVDPAGAETLQYRSRTFTNIQPPPVDQDVQICSAQMSSRPWTGIVRIYSYGGVYFASTTVRDTSRGVELLNKQVRVEAIPNAAGEIEFKGYDNSTRVELTSIGNVAREWNIAITDQNMPGDFQGAAPCQFNR